jgi:hypothetical protein
LDHGAADSVMPNLNSRSVFYTLLVKTEDFKRVANERMNRVPVFDVKKYSLTEYLRFMIRFYSQALLGV